MLIFFNLKDDVSCIPGTRTHGELGGCSGFSLFSRTLKREHRCKRDVCVTVALLTKKGRSYKLRPVLYQVIP